jgi:hypothetical protein
MAKPRRVADTAIFSARSGLIVAIRSGYSVFQSGVAADLQVRGSGRPEGLRYIVVENALDNSLLIVPAPW